MAKTGQTVKLIGGDSGTVQSVQGNAVQVLVNGELHWMGESMIVQPTRSEQHSCHYCGMDARSTGFFGEWVCNECQ